MTSPKGAYIQLQFRPNVQLISSARQFVADFYDHVVQDPAALSRILLATHELLENAVKYAQDGVTEIRIDVIEADPPESTARPTAEDGSGRRARRVQIRTSNRAAPKDRDDLKRAIDEAGSAADPAQHYRQVMLKNARRKDGSGLGLARIRAEADMRMMCTIEGEEVAIVVEAELPPPRDSFVATSP